VEIIGEIAMTDKKPGIERYEAAADLLAREGLDAIFLAPSSDLLYVSGVALHADGRPKGVLLTREGRKFLLCPALYNEDAAPLRGRMPVEEWPLEAGPAGAFARLVERAGLERGARVAFTKSLEASSMLDMTENLSIRPVGGAGLLHALRSRKSAEEMDLVRLASRRCDEMMEALSKYIRPGATERDIRNFIMNFHEDRGGRPRVPMVASGANSDKPHYFGGNNRPVGEQDIIMIDSGGWYDNYSHDCTRTFFVGGATEEQRHVYDIVLKAQLAAVEKTAPGAIPAEIDAAARDTIAGVGYGEYFPHRLGHWIGLDGQEPGYIAKENREPLKEGHCFTIEPGIYLPGKFGVRIEDVVMITAEGREVVNRFPKDLIIL
jgi:Xaa-Pro dipeptidase